MFKKREMVLAKLSAINEILIELTTNCNKSCSFCYNSYSVGNEGENIYLDDLIYVRSKIAPHVHLIFSGGEPLIYPHLFKALELYKDFSKTIITNGKALNNELVCELKKRQVKLRITLDINESAEKYYNIIKLNHYLNNVSFQITVYDETPKKVESYVSNWFKITGLPIEVNYSIFKGKASKSNFILDNLVDLSRDFISHKFFFREWNVMGQYITLPIKNSAKLSNYRDCSIGKIIKISVNGTVWPCPFMTELSNICGNIHKDSWAEIEHNVHILSSRLLDERKQQCSDCDIKCYCKGGCVAEDRDVVCHLNKPIYIFLNQFFS